jgi:hypothetical protein
MLPNCREGTMDSTFDKLPHQYRRLAAECMAELKDRADPVEQVALLEEANHLMQRARAVEHWRARPIDR